MAPAKQVVLCVDDRETTLTVHKALFGSQGYEVLTAHTAAEALAVLRAHAVSLVILDQELSDQSGAERAREIKNCLPQLPVMMLTGAAEKPERLERVDVFLSKLEPPNVVFAHVAELLSRSTAAKL